MPHINSSELSLRRNRLGYEQKQIAVLLGHKTTHQICRYETGQRIPSLKGAIKLSILYDLPVSVLFGSYFRRCREELEKTIKQSNSARKMNLEKTREAADYCSYLETMNLAVDGHISEKDSDKIRHHIKVLIDERSTKILDD